MTTAIDHQDIRSLGKPLASWPKNFNLCFVVIDDSRGYRIYLADKVELKIIGVFAAWAAAEAKFS